MYLKKTLPLTVFLLFGFLLFTIPSVHAAEPIWTYSSPGSEIKGVSVSSDGSAIAVGAGKIWLFSRNGTLFAKEPFGDQVIFSRDGSSLVSSYSTTIFLFTRKTSSAGSEPTLQKKWDYSLPSVVRSLDISEDGKTIVASVNGAGTYIFSSTGKMVGGDDRFNALVRLSSSGSRIVGVSAGVLCSYSRTGKCSKSGVDVVGAEPDFIELISSGNIAVFNDDQRVRSVFVNNKTLRWTTRATGDVTSLAMNPTGSAILVGTENGNVDLFDEYGNLNWSYASNPSNKKSADITGVALSKEGTIAAAGSFDGKVFALNSKGEEIWSNQTKDNIHHIAMNADGTLVVATGENTVYAFSTIAQPKPTVKSPVPSKTPANRQPVTMLPGNDSAQNSVTREPTIQAITVIPTEYSVIRTSTQSPLSGFIPLGAVLVALLMVMQRRK